jgi:membrane protease subunit HflK
VRRANEGAAYRAEAVASARGRSAQTVNRAEADRVARVTRSAGQADAFRYVAAARAGHPALTDHQLYWEAVSQALAGRAKLILDPGKNHPRHLIVPDLNTPDAGANAPGLGQLVAPSSLSREERK